MFFSFVWKAPVNYTKYIVPVCLAGEGLVDYNGTRATLTSLRPCPEGNLTACNITKTEKSLMIKGDVECDDRLREFDHDMRVQICTFGDFEDRLTEIETVSAWLIESILLFSSR